MDAKGPYAIKDFDHPNSTNERDNCSPPGSVTGFSDRFQNGHLDFPGRFL
jgi:hypothetical protein